MFELVSLMELVTSIFYTSGLARLIIMNGHQKDMCSNKVGLCAQYMITINTIGSSHNWKGPCDHLKRKRVHFYPLFISYATQLRV